MHPLTSGVGSSKYAYVLTADILNTCGKLICVDKQRNNNPCEHLLQLKFKRLCITFELI